MSNEMKGLVHDITEKEMKCTLDALLLPKAMELPLKKMKAVDFTCELQNFPKFHIHDHLQVLSGLKANDPLRLISIKKQQQQQHSA